MSPHVTACHNAKKLRKKCVAPNTDIKYKSLLFWPHPRLRKNQYRRDFIFFLYCGNLPIYLPSHQFFAETHTLYCWLSFSTFSNSGRFLLTRVVLLKSSIVGAFLLKRQSFCWKSALVWAMKGRTEKVLIRPNDAVYLISCIQKEEYSKIS